MNKEKILFNAFPKQMELIDAAFSRKYRTLLYGGSIRSGKSFAGLGTLIMLSRAFPGSRWAIVRDSLPTLKRNTIPSFQKIVPEAFIDSHDQTSQVVTFSNKSQIIFFSENFDDDKELNRWRGLEVNGFLLEEVNELQEKSFYKAVERAGSHIINNMPPPLIICTCNPSPGWVKELFYDRWKAGTLPDKWKYIDAKITDNPFNSNEYLENLKATMPRYEYEMFVLGSWDLQKKSGNEFYKEFDLDKHVKECAYNPSLPLWLSLDENVNPFLSASIWQIQGKVASCIDELIMRNPHNTVIGICNEFKKKFPNHTGGLIVTGDATSRKQDVKLEKGYDFYRLITGELERYHPRNRVPPSNPSVYLRGLFINTIFYSNLGGIIIQIDLKCKIMISDLQNTLQAADGTKDKKIVTGEGGVRYQQYGHLSDGLDYFINSAFASEYEQYQRGGKTSWNIISAPIKYDDDRKRRESKNGY